jgi:hypothetical protein
LVAELGDSQNLYYFSSFPNRSCCFIAPAIRAFSLTP